ncbi:MAG TPA: hypothetical protein DCM87_20580 [Planctomycetes bacterium]|jgi:hypothetical protein|nr:hypothetical protein [Planctomycetota bacterium]
MHEPKSVDPARRCRRIAAALLLAAAAVRAQIAVEGIDDRTVYTDRAAFTVAAEEGYDYAAAMNGRSVPVGEEVAVAEADFYELAVTRTPQAGGAPESDVSFDCELGARCAPPPPPGFIRGDANGDGVVDLSDPVMILLCLFAGRATDCEDALDANDGGRVDIADAVYVLSYLFARGAAMPAPFPARGEDTTPDALGCSR